MVLICSKLVKLIILLTLVFIQMISCRKLQPGKEYYIQTYEDIYFKGMIFEDYQTSFELARSVDFYTDIHMIFTRGTYYYLFREQDSYYDAEKIRDNAEEARKQMEQRALNMILKRVVNEMFEWT